MHAAPAVSYPVGRPSAYTAAFALLWMVVALVLAAFAAVPGTSAGRLMAALAGGLAALGIALYGWRRCPVGRLAWDGMRWWWTPDGAAGAVAASALEGRLQPGLDLQELLLVRFLPLEGRAHWLWLERRVEPGFWGRLRCAVMQPLPPAAPTGPKAGAGAAAS